MGDLYLGRGQLYFSRVKMNVGALPRRTSRRAAARTVTARQLLTWRLNSNHFPFNVPNFKITP